jgi:hypothetical protein
MPGCSTTGVVVAAQRACAGYRAAEQNAFDGTLLVAIAECFLVLAGT